MYTLNSIEKNYQKEEISAYKAFLTPESMENGIFFDDNKEFLRFLKGQSISCIFLCDETCCIEDFWIDDDILEKKAYYIDDKQVFESIKKDVSKYNNTLKKIDYDIAETIFAYTCFNGTICYTSFENETKTKDLLYPEDQIEEFISNYGKELSTQKEKKVKKLETLKSELKEKIFSDPNFALCTNKQLRKEYIYKTVKNLTDEHFSLIRKHWYRDGFTHLFRDAIDFIELAWREHKVRSR